MRLAVSLENPVIAVVDDDRSVCTGVQRLLRASGLSAITFTSGVDFLASLAVTMPDCIVLDLTMPEINGLAVQARLNGSGVSTPVIFISATAEGDQRRQALAAGAFRFLHKPFDGQVLIDAITLALQSRKQDT
jgi:two-component system, LuxR family, response regulator FixJ